MMHDQQKIKFIPVSKPSVTQTYRGLEVKVHPFYPEHEMQKIAQVYPLITLHTDIH
jgi:hypothetical protein